MNKKIKETKEIKENENEIVPVWLCPCSNRVYPNKNSLLQHRKTKMHTKWENERELRELKKELTKRDNELLTLKTKIGMLQELNYKLISKLKS